MRNKKQAIILYAQEPDGCENYHCAPNSCPLWQDPVCNDTARSIDDAADLSLEIKYACIKYIHAHPDEITAEDVTEALL